MSSQIRPRHHDSRQGQQMADLYITLKNKDIEVKGLKAENQALKELLEEEIRHRCSQAPTDAYNAIDLQPQPEVEDSLGDDEFYQDQKRRIHIVANNDYPGYDIDIEALKATLNRPGYEDRFTKDMCDNISQLRLSIQQLANEVKVSCSYDVIFLIILSHGGRKEGLDYITRSAAPVDSLGNTSYAYPILNILNRFQLSECPGRKGVPLVCLISSCRGTAPNVARPTAQGSPSDGNVFPNHCDNQIVMSCTEGAPGIGSDCGSYFIQKLCAFWKEKASLDEVLRKLRRTATGYSEGYQDGNDYKETFPVPSDLHNTLTRRIRTGYGL